MQRFMENCNIMCNLMDSKFLKCRLLRSEFV